MKLYGTDYGGFYYPDNLFGLNENSVIYCVGAGEDITHDLMVAHQLNSDVYIFDPTPRAIEHVKYVKNVMDGTREPINDKRFGGGDSNYWNIIQNNKVNSERLHLYDYGIHTCDDMMKFYKPENENGVSCSLVKEMKSEKYINVPVKTLKTTMKELNHSKIDLLKMDIEGSECDVLNQMLDDNIYPTYIAVEFDLGWGKMKDKTTCYNTIIKLVQNGYVELSNNRNGEMTFFRPKNCINSVIVHMGYTDYLEKNLMITSKTNRIYLIGDESVRHLGKIENVIFVNIEKYLTTSRIDNYKKNFTNYSYNNGQFELFCFMRMFIIQDFLKDYGFDKIFHIDSDNVLLHDVNRYPFTKSNAMVINDNSDELRMSNSIHSSLITPLFCDTFEQLYNDIFVNKSKFNLIEKKIKHHNTIKKGGICDMTFYYLMEQSKNIDIQNLSEPVTMNDEQYVFINNINNGEGYKSRNQYKMNGDYIDISNENRIYDKIENNKYNLFNLHYQGQAKELLSKIAF